MRDPKMTLKGHERSHVSKVTQIWFIDVTYIQRAEIKLIFALRGTVSQIEAVKICVTLR